LIGHDSGIMIRSYHAGEFSADRVLAEKAGRRVSVVIPARDEAATVGEVATVLRHSLVERTPVVDELVVVDDGSTDGTARVASSAGAVVVPAGEGGTPTGKGSAMWRGLAATTGDLVAFCDADVSGWHPGFVLGLIGPLLASSELQFVKGCYRRPYNGQPGEGGRVTELVARPALALLFPHLAAVRQPLAGECAGRRSLLATLPFVGGYGVDLGLLLDVAARAGVQAIAQCDLGERVHRNRPLRELTPQAEAVLAVALQRAGLRPDDLEECPPLDGRTESKTA
jgi:glucosyl-3-phosphoglycerate synthase